MAGWEEVKLKKIESTEVKEVDREEAISGGHLGWLRAIEENRYVILVFRLILTAFFLVSSYGKLVDIERYSVDAVYNCGKRKVEEIDVDTFIGRMVQHILPKGMQRIRYYGLHGTAVYEKIRKKLMTILPTDAWQCKETFTVRERNYRQRVIETSGKDPFICSHCGGEMILWRIWHPKYGVIYDEEKRLKAGYYERYKRGRDPDVGDLRDPVLQLSLPGLRV